MGSAPRKKFLRLQKPRNVHVSIKLWHFEWDTPGFLRRYDRIISGLLSTHARYQAFTLFDTELRNTPNTESKPEKAESKPEPEI